MAGFFYNGKDIDGNTKNGEIESGDLRTAVLTLRKKGLIVISVKAKSNESSNFLTKFLNRVSFTDLVIMTRQLATMVSSGLTLSDAIDILQEQQNNKTLKKALEEISSDVKGGLNLAQSLSKHPDVFPQLYINVIKSGEASGKIDTVLIQMANGLEKDREFQSRIKGAMIYPVIVLVMMFGVMVIMMVFVIPKLMSLYSQSNIDLPLPTKILIFVSNILVNYWWAIIIVIIGIVVVIRRWGKTPEGGMIIGRIVLKIPIIGKIVTFVTLTNFSRTFGLLTAAGIPLLESIGIVEGVMENPVYKRTLKDAYSGVEKGLPFSALLTASVFPRIVGQMVRVGEETGKVDEIFFKLSEYFESESDHMVKNLTVAIEPIIIIILGLGVGFLVISIILPIYKLTTSF